MIFILFFVQLFFITALIYWYGRTRNIVAWGLCAILLLSTAALLQAGGLEFPGSYTETQNYLGDANVTHTVINYDEVRTPENDGFVFVWSWLSMISGFLMLIWLLQLTWQVIRHRRR